MMSVARLVAGACVAAGILFPCCAATPPGAIHPGATAPGFVLTDGSGATHSLDGLLKGEGAVLIFIATQCPVSNAYNERMKQLSLTYASKGVAFIGINSNRGDSAEDVARHARDHGFPFPVVKDLHSVVADKYGAQVTPEVFLIDRHGIVRYHGRIDDNAHQERVKSDDLRTALDAFITGKDIPLTETKAFGCGIGRERRDGE